VDRECARLQGEAGVGGGPNPSRWLIDDDERNGRWLAAGAGRDRKPMSQLGCAEALTLTLAEVDHLDPALLTRCLHSGAVSELSRGRSRKVRGVSDPVRQKRPAIW